ncbi:MAG: HAD family hydrolase [Mycobacterium leprae]
MLKTILFDLDGTLLPINTDEFVRVYMKELGRHLGHLVEPEKLVRLVWGSTMKMIENTEPTRTNADVFWADFLPNMGREQAELMPVFDEFYRLRFPELKTACPGLPGVGKAVVEAALAQGYEIVLATNPLFPRMAIEERMRWIGVLDKPWRLVTTYEEMHACKPQPAYYQEVLHKIGRRPEECMMVGNDVDEDGIAEKLGIPVFYTTDFLINRSSRELPPHRTGSLADFQKLLEEGLG